MLFIGLHEACYLNVMVGGSGSNLTMLWVLSYDACAEGAVRGSPGPAQIQLCHRLQGGDITFAHPLRTESCFSRERRCVG